MVEAIRTFLVIPHNESPSVQFNFEYEGDLYVTRKLHFPCRLNIFKPVSRKKTKEIMDWVERNYPLSTISSEYQCLGYPRRRIFPNPEFSRAWLEEVKNIKED